MKMYGGSGGNLRACLTSALDSGVLLASRFGRFTHWIADRVSFRAGSESGGKEKNPCWVSNPGYPARSQLCY